MIIYDQQKTINNLSYASALAVIIIGAYGVSRLMLIAPEYLTLILIDLIFSGVRYTEKIKQEEKDTIHNMLLTLNRYAMTDKQQRYLQ